MVLNNLAEHDARGLIPGDCLQADVCIVGAGPAGLAVTRQLLGRGRRLILLDSGGRESDPASQLLGRGRNVGHDYFPLQDARHRGLGGSSAHWDISLGGGLRGARLHPLSAADFTVRDWIPFSGWPIDRAALDPFYRQASRLCGIDPYPTSPDPTGPGGPGTGAARPLPLPPEGVETAVFQIGPADRWHPDQALAGADPGGLQILTHATVAEILLAPGAARVTGVRAAAAAGRDFTVTARLVVLAAGGIENPRLLLASDRHRPGIFNGHDLAGRFFMEHPRLSAGVLIPARAGVALDDRLYQVRRTAAGWAEARLVLPEPVRRRERLYGCGVRLRRLPRGDPGREPMADGAVRYALEVLSEQAPNPASRVRLDRPRTDALGQPMVALDWRVTDRDVATISTTLDLIGAQFAARGLGRFDVPDLRPLRLRGGRHHMGTTRMHDDPARGVVDANGRVHGLANLYIAGSSVFPTGGHANPTLTIVALALRLGAHLRDRLNDPQLAAG